MSSHVACEIDPFNTIIIHSMKYILHVTPIAQICNSEKGFFVLAIPSLNLKCLLEARTLHFWWLIELPYWFKAGFC